MANPNPYVQVVLTYVRRPFSSWRGWLMSFLCFGMLIWVLCNGRSGNQQEFGGLPLIVFTSWGVLTFLAVHVKGQFADSRAHLTPGFRRVHGTVAAAAALIFAVILPETFAPVFGLPFHRLDCCYGADFGHNLLGTRDQFILVRLRPTGRLLGYFLHAIGSNLAPRTHDRADRAPSVCPSRPGRIHDPVRGNPTRSAQRRYASVSRRDSVWAGREAEYPSGVERREANPARIDRLDQR